MSLLVFYGAQFCPGLQPVKIRIVALGHKMPAWVSAGVDEYAKRMPPEARLDWIELKPEDRSSRTTGRVLALEAARIEAAIPPGALRIVCDEHGKPLNTPLLAQWFKAWMDEGHSPCFIIGSADGLSSAVKSTATHTVSLSGCVLPHGLVRVMLAEQLYRAWSMLHNHPYHRE